MVTGSWLLSVDKLGSATTPSSSVGSSVSCSGVTCFIVQALEAIQSSGLHTRRVRVISAHTQPGVEPRACMRRSVVCIGSVSVCGCVVVVSAVVFGVVRAYAYGRQGVIRGSVQCTAILVPCMGGVSVCAASLSLRILPSSTKHSICTLSTASRRLFGACVLDSQRGTNW